MINMQGMGTAPSSVRFGYSQKLIQLLDNITVTKQGNDVFLNGKPYNVKIKPDLTFVATSQDGSITLKLYHDTRTYGSPRTFTYTNTKNPSQSQLSRDPVVIGKAEKLAKAIQNADSDLDI